MDFWPDVASNLLGSLLGDLSKSIVSKIWNADEDRSKLREALREKLAELQGTLEGVRAKEAGASLAAMPSDWVDALACCPYEIEDIVDTINLAGSNQALTAKLLQTSLARATELQTKLEDLERDRQAILPNGRIYPDPESAQRLPHAPPVCEILIEEKKAIIAELRCCGFGVAIIGICGAGKTALAEAIANDASISKDFRCVSLPLRSSSFDPHEALKSLKTAKELSTNNKVLIILDGLESVALADWCHFRSECKRLHPGSKVLITTHNPQVADTTGTTKYCLRSVSHGDCFLLIRSVVEGSGNILAEMDLRSIHHNSTELADKCKGLPLLARHIGMLLSAATRGKRDKTVTAITTSSLWKQRGLDRVLASLRPISLLAQKPYLQRCVAYCSLFPSNHEFQKDTLLQLWMAEGFPPAPATTDDVAFVQRTAAECFEDLLSHSIFHALEGPLDAEPCYQMHQLLYDLAQHVASKTVCHVHVGNPVSEFSPAEYVRHLSISCDGIKNGEDLDKLLSSVKKCLGLRTFLLLRNSGQKIRQNPNFFETLGFLRVLDLSHANLTKLSNISKLKHLRYLDLSHTPLKRLPSLSKLFALQVLKLYDCDNLLCLPNDLSQLTRLMCLQVNMKGLGAMPRCIGKLTKLQSLNAFIVGNDEGYKIAELKNLNHLMESLSITKLENVKSRSNAQEANLHNKKRLERLELQWTSSASDASTKQVLEGLVPPKNLKELTIRNYSGSEFPQWLSSTEVCGMLKTIQLAHCEACEILPSLGKLPTLKILYLETMSKLRTLGHEFFGGGFLCLESLKIRDLPFLTEWTQLADGSMPRLQELQIVNCQRLEKLPPMDHLALLNLIEIHECPKLEELPRLSSSVKSLIVTESDILRERCQVGHPDWHKIRGINAVIDSEKVDTGELNSFAPDHQAAVPQSYCIQIEGSAVNETDSRDHSSEHNALSISMNVCESLSQQGIGQLPIQMDASGSRTAHIVQGSWQHQISKSQGKAEIQRAKRMRPSTT